MVTQHPHFQPGDTEVHAGVKKSSISECLSWDASKEIPCQAPATATFKGRQATSPHASLHCTPRHCTPRLQATVTGRPSRSATADLSFTPRPSLEAGRALKQSFTPRLNRIDDELFSQGQSHDLQFQAIQKLLTEQRDELHRVANVFERRLAVLCQDTYVSYNRCKASQHLSSARTAKTFTRDGKLQTSAGILDEVDELEAKSHKAQTCSCHDGPQELTYQSHQSSSEGECPAALNIDKNMVQGWLDLTSPTSGQILARTTIRKTATSMISKREHTSEIQRILSMIVHNRAFDLVTTVVIVFHAICMGAAADHSVQHRDDPEFYHIADIAFLIFYLVELMMRVCSERLLFIYSPWNIFDLLVVSCDVIGQVVETATGGQQSSFDDMSAARTFRVFRLVRLMRVLRLVRFFRELRMMVKCMLAGVKTILWVMLLLFIFIYIFAVYLIEQVSKGLLDESRLSSASKEVLECRFGSLIDACFSLFMTISGGLNWSELTDPLIALHWTNGIAFFIFIFFAAFAILNIVTGVFVENSMTAARSDDEEVLQDIIYDEGSSARKIRLLFESANKQDEESLTMAELEEHMANPEVRILLKSLGIGVHEIHGLFRLIDLDNSGTITLDEFLVGLMRLREGTTAIDLCTLIYENRRLVDKFKTLASQMEKQFQSLNTNICTFSTCASVF